MPFQQSMDEIKELLNEGAKAFNRRDYPTAEQRYKAVLNIDAANYQANSRLGSLYFEIRAYEDAITFLKNAITLVDDKFEPYLNLGLAQSRLRKNFDAIQTYKDGLDKCAMDKHVESEFSYNVARMSMELEFFQQGYKYAKRALECRPHYPEADQVRLYCYQRI